MLHHHASAAGLAPHGAAVSDTGLTVLSKLLDAAVIAGTLLASAQLLRSAWNLQYTVAALLAALAFFLLAEIARLYRPWRGEAFTRQFFQILLVWSETFFLLLLLAYVLKTTELYSRLAVGTWFLATPLLLSGWRILARRIYHRFASRADLRKDVVIWGEGALADQLAQTIQRSPWLGLNLAADLREDRPEGPSAAPAAPGADSGSSRIEHLERLARQGDFDILYIALPTTARARIAELLERLADTTVTVYLVPDHFTTRLFHGKWSSLEGIPLISVYDTPFWGVDGWVKRAEDIGLASVLLLLAAVPMLLIAAAVKLSSPGPVLFKQRRYGIHGQEIGVWKFRTMRVCQDGDQVPQATQQDPRITKLGAFLRRTSWDELPQFINVLQRGMSIVGPRPHAVAHNELYRGQIQGYRLRHKVRPGITGWAQINGWRGETDTLEKMAKRVEHDLWYIRHWSLWLDLEIVLLTAVRGFSGANAY